MKNKIELRDRIFRGIKAAVDKLITARAKEDDFLIVSKDGKIVRVPAKKIVRK
ncbi:MAG: hypothetical protein V1720_07255 [bacterium]